jgi:AraC-like DNA-binding protein
MLRAHSEAAGPVGFRVWRVPRYHAMPVAHTHPDIEINCVETGFIEYLFAGSKVRVPAGSVGVFWGGVPHQLHACSRTGRGIWLTLPIADFLRWPLPAGLPEKLMGGAFAQMPLDVTAANRWLADFTHGGIPQRRVLLLEVEATLHRLALHNETPAGQEDDLDESGRAGGAGSHIARVTAFLARHYSDDLSLPEIAAAVQLNPRYLARIFKAGTRLTVYSYLNRLRIAHAQRLLATTDLRVIDVALQSGFGSLASFYAAFARVCGGTSPHRYRKKLVAGRA